MKCRTCGADLCDEHEFCYQCGTSVTEPIVILCCGRRKDGSLCGAELQEKYSFCTKCGTKVDHALFQKKQSLCMGLKEDGSSCGNLLNDADEFCLKCGTQRGTFISSSQQDDNLSFATATASSASGNTDLFSIGAKIDGGNVDAIKKEQTSAPGLEISSTTIVQGNSLVFGMNSQLDGEDWKEDNALFQGSSMTGKSRVLEYQVDRENTGYSPSSGSSDPVSFHANDLDNDPEDEEANFAYHGKSASRNSADLENKLSHVTLSEGKQDDFIILIEDGSCDDSDRNGEVECSDDSSLDSSDTELLEDEVTKPASQEPVAADEQMMTRPKHKRKKKKYQKRDRKKKKTENKKNKSDESFEQLQKPQQEARMEIDENSRGNDQPAEAQGSDLQLLQKNLIADDSSVILVGLVGASASQMEKDGGKASVQSKQDGDGATSSGVDEMSKEGTNEGQIGDKNASPDKAPIQESGNSQDPHIRKEVTLMMSYAQIVETGKTQHGDQLNKQGAVESMKTDQSSSAGKIEEPRGNPDNQPDNVNEGHTNSGIKDTESKQNRVENEKSGKKTRKASKDAQNIQQDSKGLETSNDEENKKKARNDSSQNTSSKGGAADGSGTGKNATERKSLNSVKIHFHALLSPEFDLIPTDVVLIRFGENELGGFESKMHRYKPELVRKTDDQFTEVKLEADIPKRFIAGNKSLQYKYLVAKDRTLKDKETKYIWENYHAHGHMNRTLYLPDKMKNIAEWHQYDGIVYPKPDEGFLGKVKSLITGEINEREKGDLVQSVEYFLPKFFKDISSGQLPTMSADEALLQLEELLYALRRVYFMDRRCYKYMADYEKKVSDMILVPVLKSFEGLPPSDFKESPTEAQIRMLRATAVVSALRYFMLELNQENQDLLARGLLLRRNHETGLCQDLDCIEINFPQGKRKHLSDSLISFIDNMAKTAKSPSIFFCIPLHHFLAGEMQPIGKITEDFSHEKEVPRWWGITSLNNAVDSIKKMSSYRWTVNLEQIVSILHPLFEMDYLLPRTFMAMLTLEELGEVIKTGKIPVEVCAATLFYYVKITRPDSSVYYMVSHVDRVIYEAINVLRDVCRAVPVPNESSRSDIIQARIFLKVASDLLNETLGPAPQFLVAGTVQIFLHAVAAYDIRQRNESSDKRKTRHSQDHLAVLSRLYEGVKKWHGVHLQNWSVNLQNHLQGWNNIFASADLPSEAVKEAWNSQTEKDLHDILRSEMQKVSYFTKDLIYLYCGSLDSFHPSIQNCLSQLAFKAIETGYNVTMHQFGNYVCQRFGSLLSSLFEREWNTAMTKSDMKVDRIILHHILIWTPFSHFLKMFCEYHFLDFVAYLAINIGELVVCPCIHYILFIGIVLFIIYCTFQSSFSTLSVYFQLLKSHS